MSDCGRCCAQVMNDQPWIKYTAITPRQFKAHSGVEWCRGKQDALTKLDDLALSPLSLHKRECVGLGSMV
ncbi:hypothetical protein ILYODFUR_026366 [Ilyodon furcidens]|uniref:Uncharacterized protein n=1 Tax=Ilyodon furcidens TaxID=33524 RepID=A0ABV0UVC9_9TELE